MNLPCARGLTGPGGRRCPEFEFCPATIEGAAVLASLERPGNWHRAGMAGVPSGLNLSDALAALPDECDRSRARALFLIAEVHFLNAHGQTKPATE